MFLEKFYKNPENYLTVKCTTQKDNTLGSLQVAHMKKEINLYAPVSIYTEVVYRFNKGTEQLKPICFRRG